jgi:hypothetical protein
VVRAAKGAQRERDLRLQVERGVATGKYETQPVIFKRAAHFLVDRAAARLVLIQQLAFVVAACLFPARVVDELATSRGCDPGAGIAWDTFSPPAYDCGGEGVLHGLLSQVEGVRDTNKAGDDTP